MLGYDFHRQIPLLNFIADFYCEKLNLVIEVDGITHHDDIVAIKDDIKDTELKKVGINVMRFSDREILKDMVNVTRAVENYILDYGRTFWNRREGLEEKKEDAGNDMGGWFFAGRWLVGRSSATHPWPQRIILSVYQRTAASTPPMEGIGCAQSFKL